MKFTPTAALVKSEINTHLDADKIVRKMTFTPGKIAQKKMAFTPGKIAQTKINQPAQPATQPKQDYVVVSVTETVLDPVVDSWESLPIAGSEANSAVVMEPAIEVPVETVVDSQNYDEQVYEQPVVEVSTDLASVVY